METKLFEDMKEVKNQLEGVNSLPEYLDKTIKKYGEYNAIIDEYSGINLTYAQLGENISLFAGGLQSLGITKGDFICLFTENTGRYPIIDQAILKCGAIDVLRGSNAAIEELDYIMGHCDATAAILKDDKAFHKLKECFNKHNLKFIVIMYKNEKLDTESVNCPVYFYDDIIEKGKIFNFTPVEIKKDDWATMLYTSGTTGLPKGVLLTHKNFLSQIIGIHENFSVPIGEKTLQILPVWHSYERMGQYYNLTRACHLHFSSLANLKNDMVKYQVGSMMSVPRIWEALRLGIYQSLKKKSKLGYYLFDFAVKISVNYKIHKMYSEKRITNKKTSYNIISNLYHKIARSFIKPLHILFTDTLYKKIKEAAGLKNIRTTVSGGGALSIKDELFYDAIGVCVIIGYGLTETSPLLALRTSRGKNYLGSTGKPVYGTELKIVDVKTKEELNIFQKGIVMVRGAQVMKGYYKDEESTKKVLDENGWFNTGDLGWLTGDNNLVLVGRIKETIVLSNGENIEPVPIEEAILGSPYISQIVLVGQDQNSVGALVVPSEDALKKCGILAKELKSGKTLEIKNPDLKKLIKNELNTYIKNKIGLKPFENIKQFEILKDSFSMDNGLLSQTAKIKRNKVFEKYKELIAKMFKK